MNHDHLEGKSNISRNPEIAQNSDWAEPINWDAPMMTSQEKSKVFFAELEEFAGQQIEKIQHYQKSLKKAGLWETYTKLYALEQEGVKILKEWDQKLPIFEDSFGIQQKLSDAIYESDGKERERLYGVEDKYRSWLSTNGELRTELRRKLYVWEEKQVNGFKDPSDHQFFHSPYFKYLLINSDQLNQERFVAECKKAYRQLTVDDYVELIDQALDGIPPGGEIFLYMESRKSQQDPSYQDKKAKESGLQHFFSSDEFMTAFVEGKAKQKEVLVHVIRSQSDVLKLFMGDNHTDLVSAMTKIQNAKILVIDDAAYSGIQKLGMDYKVEDIHVFTKPDDVIALKQLLPVLRKKLEYYFVGVAQPAKEAFRLADINFHFQRYLPSVSEIIPEPDLTLLRQIWAVYGSYPTLMKSYVTQNKDLHDKKNLKNLENYLKKTIAVGPFKTPDWVSVQQFWTESLKSHSLLFSLATKHDEAASAYLNPQDLIAGYEK